MPYFTNCGVVRVSVVSSLILLTAAASCGVDRAAVVSASGTFTVPREV